MRVEANANYDVLLNPNDLDNLVNGKGTSFWIIEDDKEIVFKIKRDVD